MSKKIADSSILLFLSKTKTIKPSSINRYIVFLKKIFRKQKINQNKIKQTREETKNIAESI